MSEKNSTASVASSKVHAGKEVWKDIVGYEGLYQVSDWGRVKSVARFKKIKGGGLQPWPERLLSFKANRDGRLQASLWKDNKEKKHQIHRLVLEAFVGPCPEGMEGCHNDGDYTNNNLDNLRWDTKSNNHQDRKRHGTAYLGTGNTWKLKGKREEIYELHLKGFTELEIATKYGVTWQTISYHIRMERKKRCESQRRD